jgi:hypothetical protein
VNGWTVELRPDARKSLRQMDDGARRDAIDMLEDIREEGLLLTNAPCPPSNTDEDAGFYAGLFQNRPKCSFGHVSPGGWESLCTGW